jgi:hypothetical protein
MLNRLPQIFRSEACLFHYFGQESLWRYAKLNQVGRVLDGACHLESARLLLSPGQFIDLDDHFIIHYHNLT